MGDISGSEEQSSPERPSTPTFTDDIVPQRPRPPGFAAFGAADGEKKEKSKMKAIKMKFTKKKVRLSNPFFSGQVPPYPY